MRGLHLNVMRLSTPAHPSGILPAALAVISPLMRQAMAYSVVIGLLAVGPTIYMFQVYDRVIGTRNHLTLLMLALLLLGILVVMGALEALRGRLLLNAANRLDAQLSEPVFRAAHQAKLRGLGNVGAQPMDDLHRMREFMLSPALVAAMDVPMALVFLATLIGLHPLLGLVAGAVTAAIAASVWVHERSARQTQAASQEAGLAAQQVLDAANRQAATVAALGMMDDVRRRWWRLTERVLTAQLAAAQGAARVQAFAKGLQLLTGSALLGLAAWLTLDGSLWGGAASVIVASVLGGKAMAPLVQLAMQWRVITSAPGVWRRLDDLLRACPPRTPGMMLPAPSGRLVVEQASVTVPDGDRPLLRGLHFQLDPGEALVVIGPSGAGKSTLARALVGLWPAANGQIRLDGAELFQWDKAHLGPHLGYLPQAVALFEGTLADNIARFGAPDSLAVEEAGRLAGLDPLVQDLDQGYATVIGRDGLTLSGGWRQRVGLARALYGRPALVILDEPNASLDEAGEQALGQAIESCKAAGTTFVIMSHRTRILAVADKVLMLRDGMQEAFGTRQEVLAAVTRATAAGKASA